MIYLGEKKDMVWNKHNKIIEMERATVYTRITGFILYFYASLFGTFFAISFDILRCRNVTGNP